MRADMPDIIALNAAVTFVSPDSLSAISVGIHIVIRTCTVNIKGLDSDSELPCVKCHYIHVLL